MMNDEGCDEGCDEECSAMWDTRGCESRVRDVMTSNEESVMISVKRSEE